MSPSRNITSYLMFIFPEKLKIRYFSFIYIISSWLAEYVIACCIVACPFRTQQVLGCCFCFSFMLSSPQRQHWNIHFGQWKLSPSSFTQPNIFMGFANKKNKLNLIQFSPQAILSLQRSLEWCHMSVLSPAACTNSFPADVQMWWKLQISKIMADVGGWCLKSEWFVFY